MLPPQETRITVTAAAEILGRRRGSKVTAGMVGRWALEGVRGVVLESELIGGCRVTTAEAVDRWLDALNGRTSAAVS